MTEKLLGHLSVDAGLIQMGDPCYLKSKKENIFDPWDKFCEALDKAPNKNGPFKFDFSNKLNEKGLKNIVLSGFGGDGCYPVYGKYDEEGLLVEVKIVFWEE